MKSGLSIPMPGKGLPLVVSILLFLLASAGVSLVWFAVISDSPRGNRDGSDAVVLLLFLTAGWGVLAAYLFVRPFLDWRRSSQMRSAGRDLGLRPVPTPSLDELEEYRGFPLFRYSRQSKRAAVWAMEGRFQKVPVRLIEYAFEGTTVDHLGYKRVMRDVQTIAVLPEAGPRARFYLGSASNDWSDIEPGWQMMQGLLSSLEFSRADVPVPPVVHARDDETIQAIFTPQRQDELAMFEGWVIECCQGTLLVYRHDRIVRPHELPRFLDMVVRISDILRDTAGWMPSNAESPRDDRPEPPRQGIRRDEDY